MRSVRLACVVGAFVVSTMLGTVDPAAGHGGDGVAVVEHRQPLGYDTVEYVVRLTWSLDGHPADLASLVATPVGPYGTVGSPVAMVPVDHDGRYAGTVVFPGPGSWTVQFTAPDPVAHVEIVEEVGMEGVLAIR